MEHTHGHNGNGRLKLDWPKVVATVVAWLVAVMLAYGAMNTRVAVIEERYDRLTEDVREMKSDLKTLLRRSAP